MIIGLHGKASAGKDTFADCLKRHGFVKRGFADPIYEEAAAAFGVTVAWLRDRSRKELPQDELMLSKCRDDGFLDSILSPGCDIPRSPRWILQQWGTEYRRAQDIDYWLRQAAIFCKAALDTGARGVVFVDTRFENEAEWVRSAGGVIVDVRRPGAPDVEGGHVSAVGFPPRLIDHVIYNSLDLATFQKSVDEHYPFVLSGKMKRAAPTEKVLHVA